MDTPNLRPVPLDQTRQRIVEQLCDHYAVENLTDEALDERLRKAYAATSPAELTALVADLPVAPVDVAAPGQSLAVATTGEIAERQVLVAVMSGTERHGVWTPPRELNVVAVMGGAELDFRQARFGPGVTVVNCFALMGGVQITVPPGVQVEMNGMAIMGGFVQKGMKDAPLPPPGAPVLRIGGFALMGGVEVDMRHAGESSGDARRRERLHRAELRRLRRGT